MTTRHAPRRRAALRPASRVGLSITFAAGVIACVLALGMWIAMGGPQMALEGGFMASVPLTIIGIVLVTSALLRGSWAIEARRAAQLATLQRAAKRMSASLSVGAVGRAIVEETGLLIDYHNARVYVLEQPDMLIPIAFEGRVGAYERVDLELLKTRVGDGFTGWVAKSGRPLLIDDANTDPRGVTVPGTDDVDESMLVVPMRHDETLVGVITLSKLGLRQFDDEDLRLLEILADQAATALESARLLGRTRELAAELRRLLDMSSDLSSSLDPRAVADLIADHVARALEVDEVAVSYWERRSDGVQTLGYYPAGDIAELEPYYELARFPLTRRVLEEQRLIVIDADDPNADPAEADELRRQGLRSLLMVPLVAKGQAIGLLELMGRGPAPIDGSRRQLARTMANEAAMALENARLYDEARRLADRDPLTGFFNHRYLHERLGEEIVRAQRTKRPLALLMLDLDDFKVVNDTFGHLFGDRVLVHGADLIRGALRASDVPARYGGDEFAVILPEADAEAAGRAAERIAEALHDAPYQAEGRLPVLVSASIGVACYPADGRAGTELIAAADRRLYQAKAGAPETAAPAAASEPDGRRGSSPGELGARAVESGPEGSAAA